MFEGDIILHSNTKPENAIMRQQTFHHNITVMIRENQSINHEFSGVRGKHRRDRRTIVVKQEISNKNTYPETRIFVRTLQ